MTAEKSRRRYADAGRCTLCSERVVRGYDDTGQIVSVEITGTTSAIEQIARANGRGTFVLAWVGMGMTIRRRTDDDVLLRPARFRAGERVVVEHRCRDTEEGKRQ